MPQLDCATFSLTIISLSILYIGAFGIINSSSFFYYCNTLKMEAKRYIFIYFGVFGKIYFSRVIGLFPLDFIYSINE